MGALCCLQDSTAVVVMETPSHGSSSMYLPNDSAPVAAEQTPAEKPKIVEASKAAAENEETTKAIEAAKAAEAEEAAQAAKKDAAEAERRKKEKEHTAALQAEAAGKAAGIKTISDAIAEKGCCVFTIKLQKSHADIKWNFKFTPSADGKELIVTSFDGSLKQWQANNKTKQVLLGDEILTVNTYSGTAAELMKRLSGKDMELEIVLKRRIEMTCNITKNGRLGISFDQLEVDNYRVVNIGRGCIDDYNRRQLPNLQVHLNDRFVGIDGYLSLKQILEGAKKGMSLEDALDDIKDGEKLKLVFARSIPEGAEGDVNAITRANRKSRKSVARS